MTNTLHRKTFRFATELYNVSSGPTFKAQQLLPYPTGLCCGPRKIQASFYTTLSETRGYYGKNKKDTATTRANENQHPFAKRGLQGEISIHHWRQRGKVDAEATYLLARGCLGSDELLLAASHEYAALFREHNRRRVVPPAGNGDLSSVGRTDEEEGRGASVSTKRENVRMCQESGSLSKRKLTNGF